VRLDQFDGRKRALLALRGAYGLSALGDFAALTALTIYIQERSGSGVSVAALLLAGLAPQVLLSPFGGRLVDRVETVRMLIIASLVQALALGIMALWLGVGTVLLGSLVLGIAAAAVAPGVLALVPVVAPGSETRANAKLEVARTAGAAIGPVVGGVMTGSLGPQTVLLLDSATFVLVIGGLLLSGARRPASVSRPQGREGLRRGMPLWTTFKDLRVATLTLGATVLFASIVNVAMIFFAREDLGVGEGLYGALLASWSIGMIIGSSSIASRIRSPDLATAVVLACLAAGLVLMTPALLPLFAVALGAFVLNGAANGIERVGIQSLVHLEIPRERHGRAFGELSATLGGAQLIAFLMGGFIVDVFGGRLTLLLAGLGCTVAGSLGTLALRRAIRPNRQARRAASPPLG
jgi:MFS family permease